MWETVLVFAVVPFGVLALLALLVFGPGMTRSARYRPGRPWSYDPVWYLPRSEAAVPVASPPVRAAVAGARAGRALPPASGAGGTRAGSERAGSDGAGSSSGTYRGPASVLDVAARTARGGASGEW